MMTNRLKGRQKSRWAISACLILLLNTAVAAEQTSLEKARQQVIETEQAFADTMKNRDFEAFKSFVAEDAVFLTGSGALRGKAAIAEGWGPLYKEPIAPFSWEPGEVEVLESGRLAFSTGPVYDPSGKMIAIFHSVWRMDDSHQWRIVFDGGTEPDDFSKP